MPGIHSRLRALILISFCLAWSCVAHADPAAEIATLLAGDAPQVHVAGERLWSTPMLRRLHADPAHAPRWTAARLAVLGLEIARAAEDGLTPADFLATRLENLSMLTPAERELIATEALARLAFTLRYGKCNPRSLDPDWNYSRRFGATDPTAWLRDAITTDALPERLAALRPTGPWYGAMVAALADYRARAARGGWEQLPAGATLKPGMVDDRVPRLRARLAAGGDVVAAAPGADPNLFDDALRAAVERFQQRHGLTADAAVGRATLAALNVPVAARIDALRVNLERVRWVFRDVEEKFVVINIAAFYGVYFDHGAIRWRGRAIVGRPYRQTPIFKDRLSYLELNPTWTVPPTILRNDVLPRLREDPGYLESRKLRVIDPNGGPVDAGRIDWTKVSATHFPYLLRQAPGPDNALGRIKFMFPNAHAVYLHDTPTRELFDRDERVFSSGCIRIDDPLGLAERLLEDSDRWSQDRIAAAIASGRTQRVDLPRPVTIMLVYLTAFPNETGAIEFRRDVYLRDRAVLAALDAPLTWTPPTDFDGTGSPAAP